MKNTDKHNTGPPYNTYRLRFTDAEGADPALTKAIRKADKDADKLEVVQAKIHKKKILKSRRTVDAETGKSTVRLCFEEINAYTIIKRRGERCSQAKCETAKNCEYREF